MSTTLKKEKPAIVFYGSNLDVISLFTEEEQQELVLRIMEYGFDSSHTEAEDDLDIILQPIFDGIRVQKNRHNNIAYINKHIATINRNTVDLTEKAMTDKIGKAIALLRQEIAICQDSDMDSKEVAEHVSAIVNNPTVARLIRDRSSSDAEYRPTPDYATRYAGQRVR